MRNALTLFTLASVFFNAHAQGLNYIQNIVPHPPEASAILKSFETPVSLYTGSPSISVPIYSIREGDINFDIQLSYNSTGITVGERASWVGLGWNLSIPALVRNIRQIPDDAAGGFFYENQYKVNSVYNIQSTVGPNVPITQIGQLCPQCYEIDYKYKAGQLDLESDDYRLTLPDGKNISFMVNQERDSAHPIGHIVQFPDSDYKIEYTSSGNWEITNPQGFKYLFVRGNKINFSYVYTIGGSSIGTEPEKKDTAYTSSWVLSTIKSPSNHILNFEYDPITYEDCDLVNQTKTVATNPDNSNDPRNTVYSNYSKTRGINLYISRIWGDFGEVLFNKEGRLDYTTYGKRLNNIEIKNKSGIINKVGFNYDYMTSISPTPIYTCNRFENDADISKRLRLKTVSLNINTLKPVSYQFNYNSTALPHRLSFARDWWGYYNGENNNMGLTPSIDLVLTEDNNRNVKPDFAKAGVLEEIIYPTKGKTKFQYESNRGVFHEYDNEAAQKIHDIVPYIIQDDLFSTTENTTQTLNKVYEHPIPIIAGNISNKSGQTIEIVTNTTKCIYADDSIPLTNSCSLYYTILDNNNNIVIPKALLRNNNSRILEIPRQKLVSGLKMKIEVYAGKNNLPDVQLFDYAQDEATVRFIHKSIDPALASSTSIGIEIPFGGLRIKRIENYDNTLNPIIKEYNYKDDQGVESGLSLFELDFLQNIPGKLFVTSQSRFPMQSGNGNLISYTNAIEYRINPLTNERNNIAHIFDNRYLWGNYLGSCFFNDAYNQNSYSGSVPCYESPMNGKTVLFNYSDKRKEFYDYQNIMLMGKNLNRVYGLDMDRVIKPKDFIYATGGGTQTYLGADFYYYNFKNFDEPDYSKETKEFINGQELTTKIQYSSLSPSHHQTTHQTTTFSDGTITETSYQYAHEKNNTRLINANMIGIPLETSVIEKENLTDSGTLVSKSETKYDDASHLFPSSAVSYNLASGNASTQVTFNTYDAKGNLLQYTTKEGIPTSIIWGYNGTQPIAKIEGAVYGNIKNNPLITAIITASDSDAANPATEGNLITALDALRNDINFKDFQMATFTYDALIGVTTLTPPSGIREIYKYDSANRLEKIVDEEGKILKEYKYNYKP